LHWDRTWLWKLYQCQIQDDQMSKNLFQHP
jgi:hypothetical protein